MYFDGQTLVVHRSDVYRHSSKQWAFRSSSRWYNKRFLVMDRFIHRNKNEDYPNRSYYGGVRECKHRECHPSPYEYLNSGIRPCLKLENNSKHHADIKYIYDIYGGRNFMQKEKFTLESGDVFYLLDCSMSDIKRNHVRIDKKIDITVCDIKLVRLGRWWLK